MIGHGIGILGIEPPYLTQDNGVPLEAGMCFTPEPATYAEYGAFHQEHNVIVTEEGHKVLSTVSTELYEI
jgi:Xaa-Pro aminopeptidase